MNKVFAILLIALLLVSCNKEKHSRKGLNGSWEITSYSEVIFDGTSDHFTLNSGSAEFGTSKNDKTGTVKIEWNAENDTDTSIFYFSGSMDQISLSEWNFDSPNDQYSCQLNRQLKKDIILEMVVNPNRKSVLVLKKK